MDGDGRSLQEIPVDYDYSNIIPDTGLPQVRRDALNRSRPLPDPDIYDIPSEWYPPADTELVPPDTSALDIEPSSRRHRRAYMRSRHEEQRSTCYGSGDVGVTREIVILNSPPSSSNRELNTGGQLASTQSSKPRSNITNKKAVSFPASSTVSSSSSSSSSHLNKQKENVDKSPKISKEDRKKLEILRRKFRENDVGAPPVTTSTWYLEETLLFRCLLKKTRALILQQLNNIQNSSNKP